MEGSRIVFPALEKRSREIQMQSEAGWPQIIWGHPSEGKAARGVSPHTPPKAKQPEECPHTPLRRQSNERSVPTRGRPVKSAPNIAIPSGGPSGRACQPEALRRAQIEMIKGKTGQRIVRGVGSITAQAKTSKPSREQPQTVNGSHSFFWAPFILLGDWK